MPAREMYFTFDKDVKVNKKTLLEFVKDFDDKIRINFNDIKKEFNVSEINTEFLKLFIKELKLLNSVSIEDNEVHGKQKIIKDFIYDIISFELSEPTTILGIRYLYDKWDYEGCGYNDHYYFTYTDDKKKIKYFIKEAEKNIDILRKLGVTVNVMFELPNEK